MLVKPGEDMANDRDKLVWADVQEAAKLAFNVWVGRPELLWAQRAWELLSKAGLTQFSTELALRSRHKIRSIMRGVSRLLFRCLGRKRWIRIF
jgi:hypothetical protein